MNVGRALLDLVLAAGCDCAFVLGTGKNVGKTVTARALYEAALHAGLRVAITSVGRDGEAFDAIDSTRAKPRLFLRAGTTIATARGVLTPSPASVVLESSSLRTSAGALVYARIEQAAYHELVGPSTASGVREAVDRLRRNADVTIVDGAIDRVAAVAGGSQAIIVAGGAAAAATMPEAVDALRAIVQRLRIAPYNPEAEFVRIDGALTPSLATALLRSGEARQVVVRDPTQIALSGKSAIAALAQLNVRCERPLRLVAATVAAIAGERSFEPRAFALAAADATALPTFDVYAGTRAA